MSSTQPTLTAINKLKTNPNNPRAIRKDQLDKLVKSLREFPEMLEARPIVVDPDFVVLGGNMRLKAAQLAGLTEVPVYVATWEEAKHKEFIIKDNLAFGEWDWDMLANEWDAEELDDWGLDVPLEDEPTEGLTDPDEVPEVPEEPTTKPGDLWILGEHRLLCGDSTKAEDVERLLDGEKADMVFTDPPYGMFLDTDYDAMFAADKMHRKTGKRFYEVAGDHDDFKPELIGTIFAAFPDADEIFIWGADYFSELIPDRKEGSWVVWDKRTNENMDKVSGNTFELCWSKKKHKRLIARILWSGHHGMAKDDTKTRVHPTQKPVELVTWFFDQWGKDGKTVADPFLGSGSTLIACEKTGRKCYGMELDPKYCDVIVKRWEDFTGKKAELWKQ